MTARGSKTHKSKGRKTTGAAPSIAVLQKQVDVLTRELKEANERQTATAEVLQVINSSPGDLAPVFDAILEKAHRLCAVSHGSLMLYDGETSRAVAVRGLSEAFAAYLRQGFVPGPNLPHHQLLEGARFAQIPDWAEVDDPTAHGALGAGVPTTLYIPLRRKGELLGYITAGRPEVRPFSEKEIALLESFAAQAVIAMENARLFGEVQAKTRDLEESLQQQTATSEVLQIISSSPGELESVFQAMLENATRVCGAEVGTMLLREDGLVRAVARYNSPAALAAARGGEAYRPPPGSALATAIATKNVAQIADLRTSPAYAEGARSTVDLVELGGARTVVVVPMLRDDEGNRHDHHLSPGDSAVHR